MRVIKVQEQLFYQVGSTRCLQIGVWKALRKMHIKYDIITGTSVGAINGAMMNKDYFRALWTGITLI